MAPGKEAAQRALPDDRHVPNTVVDVPAAPVLLAVGLLLLAVGLSRRSHTRRDIGWVVAGSLYAMAVLYVTLFPMTLMLGDTGNEADWWSQVAPIPLVTLSPPTFVANIVLFLPLGALLALAPRPLGLRTAATVGLACSGSIEVTQFALNVAASTGRSSDVNDLIANVLGAVAAFSAIRASRRFASSGREHRSEEVHGVP